MTSFTQFLGENKIWWILPIVLVLAIVGFILFTQPPVDESAEDSPFQYDMY